MLPPVLTKHIMRTLILLTVCVYVPKFIVEVKQASDAVLHGGDGSVSSQDVFIELEMWRGAGPVQQPRSV